MQHYYTEDFYKALQQGAQLSAKEIIPLVLELIQPKSVIDVGCGSGTWLAVFKEHGVLDVLGVDGNYVDKKMLEIPQEQFLSFDLKNPLEIDRKFDLVVSLEVAEHLPREYAENFVNSLIKLGPVILFSAAIPFQGGINHLNEEWPDYWVKYFKDQGYVAIDSIRKKIWQNDNVEFWYIQNILIFADTKYLDNNFLLKREFEKTSNCQISIVHPKKYLDVAKKHLAAVEAYIWYSTEAEKYKAEADPRNMSLKKVLKAIPFITVYTLKRRIKGLFCIK